jgi:sRNA-binding protein
LSPEWVRRVAIDRDGQAPLDRRPFERSPETVDHAAKEGARGTDLQGSPGADNGVVGSHSRQHTERHRDDLVVAEAYDLAQKRSAATIDGEDVAHARTRYSHPKREPGDAEDSPRRTQRRGGSQLRSQGFGVHEASVQRVRGRR